MPGPRAALRWAPQRSFNRARLRRKAFSGPIPSTTIVGRTNNVAMAQPDPRIRDTMRPPASERIAVRRKRSPIVAAQTDQTRIWKKLAFARSEEHTSELQSQSNLVCRLLLEKKKRKK